MEHEFDGIQEFDNRLPNWWLWIMWGSMVFALFYWLVFHTLGCRPLPRETFEPVMQAGPGGAAGPGRRPPASTTSSCVMMSQTAAKVAEGREIFVKHCVACHLDDGPGLGGPQPDRRRTGSTAASPCRCSRSSTTAWRPRACPPG